MVHAPHGNAITVQGVSKTFRLPHEQHNSIKSALINLMGGHRGYELQQVLDDIGFTVAKGEFFGIVGRNGSGKSTLLKLLAGIYTPDAGDIHVAGKLTPFIELGVGFNPELSGRENVYLNGALLGFNRADMDRMYGDIVDFAELERFMDQKLKNYSSGMQVRLAFSIAIRARSDILLLDEVLAVGDEAFQRKCYDYFDELKRNKKTVILVTHDMAAVEKFCDRAILIEAGEIVHEGHASAIAQSYRELFNPDLQPDVAAEPVVTDTVTRKRWGDHRLRFTAVTPGRVAAETVEIGLDVEVAIPLEAAPIIAYTVKATDGRALFGDNAPAAGLQGAPAGSVHRYTLAFPNFLAKGSYLLDVSLRSPLDNSYCDFWEDCATVVVSDAPENDLGIAVRSSLRAAR